MSFIFLGVLYLYFLFVNKYNKNNTGGPKTGTLCFVRLNFVKYWPIFKLISLSESGEHCILNFFHFNITRGHAVYNVYVWVTSQNWGVGFGHYWCTEEHGLQYMYEGIKFETIWDKCVHCCVLYSFFRLHTRRGLKAGRSCRRRKWNHDEVLHNHVVSPHLSRGRAQRPAIAAKSSRMSSRLSAAHYCRFCSRPMLLSTPPPLLPRANAAGWFSWFSVQHAIKRK